MKNKYLLIVRTFLANNAWLGIPLFLFVIIRFFFGFNGLYGQDSHEYLRVSTWLTELFQGHYSNTSFFWPVVYPMFGGLLSLTGINIVWALQLISLLSFIGTLWVSHRIIVFVHPNHKSFAKYFVMLILMAAPYFLRAAFLGMSDMLATFFLVSVFYTVLRYLKEGGSTMIFLAGVFGTLAFFTRYATGLVLVIPMLVMLHGIIKKKNFIALVLAALLSGAMAALFIFLKGDNYYGLMNHLQIQGWNVMNFFRDSFNTIDGTSQYRIINVFYALSVFIHPGYLSAGLLLLFFIRRPDFTQKKALFFLLPVLLYLVFVMGMPFQNMRFLLLVFPLVAIWLFPAFVRAFEWIKRFKSIKIVAILMLIMINLSMFIYSFRPFALQNSMEQDIAGALVSKYSPKVPLYTFSIDPALKSYGVQNPVYNLWQQEFTTFVPGSLVLFNLSKFEVQWKDKNPMKNWESLKKSGRMKLLERFSDGWELYEIK